MSALTVTVKVPCPVCDGDVCTGDDAQCDDEGLVDVELPAKYEVCDRCRGEGKHCNPAIDGNGLTADDFAEDPDFEESYFRGDYDVTCERCHGLRVVAVADVDHLNAEQKAQLAAAEKRLADIARWDAEDAYTRRMERGGW